MIAPSGGAPIADVVQFDRTTTTIAEYAVGLDRTLISVSARQTMTRRLIEAIGCALGAFEAKPCVSARGLAASSTSNPARPETGGGSGGEEGGTSGDGTGLGSWVVQDAVPTR